MPTTKTDKECQRFVTRMPAELHKNLSELARRNRRSINSELLISVERHLAEKNEMTSTEASI